MDASPRLFGTAYPAAAAAGWCASLATSNAHAIAPHLVTNAGCKTPELDCTSDDAGAAWGFEVRTVNVKLQYDECVVSTDVDLVRSDGAGRIRAPAGAGLALSQEGSPGYVWGVESARVRVLGDYDGDGDQEVLVTREFWGHEAERGSESSVWTMKRSALERYAPASSVVVYDVVDADHDGKQDLVTRGPYANIRAWSALGFSYAHGPAIFLAHALADGTFSMTDPVAVAFTKAKCAAATEDNELLACERVRGKTESAVLAARKRAGCVDFLEDPQRYPQSCPKWMPDLAAITPPLRF